MKVLFLIGMLKFSGAENVLKSISKEMLDKGVDVSIAVRVQHDADHYEGVPVYSCVGSGKERILHLRKLIKEQGIQIVVGFGFPFTLDAVLLKLLTGCKAVVCERHDPSSIQRSKLQSLEKKVLYPLADKFVVQTHLTKKYYLAQYTRKEEKVSVIFNPVRYEKPGCVADACRKKEIVSVGRYDDAQKNFTMLIQAVAQLHDAHPEYVLRLYGEGNDRGKYEALIRDLNAEDYIFLMGYESKPLEKIKDAEVFCITSNYEGMPNALIEAMSVGLPCVATDCGGGAAAELIRNEENGILIPCSDVKRLVEAIQYMIENKDAAWDMARNAYLINDELSLEEITKKWITAFSSLV